MLTGEAILGGTFNPVHVGHIRLGLEVAEALGLARVWLTPCAVPPHKPPVGLLPFDLRVDLLREALRGVPLLDVNTLEGELEGPSYTSASLEEWNRRHPGPKPYFVLGVEDFAALDTWKRGAELPLLAHLVVVPRAGSDRALFDESVRRYWPGTRSDGEATVNLAGGGQCTFLPVPRLDVSASFLRERWLAGRAAHGLTPPSVLAALEARREDVARIWRAIA